MRPVILPTQTNSGYPLIDETGILPGADVIGVLDSAGKHEIVKRPSSTFRAMREGMLRAGSRISN